MTEAIFTHHDLVLLNPSFESDLVDIVNELEKLRYLSVKTNVHPKLFLQLKSIFHMLESLGSARIEGNHTTLSDYVESKIDNDVQDESLNEINNIEIAMSYIDQHLESGAHISEHTIRELHALTVQGLSSNREGDKTPGSYRQGQVRISQSKHLPPESHLISGYMIELVDFINKADKPKYDLIKMALAHHRFGWIHPFSNGNGRTVRLLTYALLIKYGFNVQIGGRILNPTAIFCSDREKYYEMLSVADRGSPKDLEQWCIYVLSGILDGLRKVDQLANLDFLSSKILYPALENSYKRGLITRLEKDILILGIEQGTVKTQDLTKIDNTMDSRARTYQISKMLDNKMLDRIEEKGRIYVPSFMNNSLLRSVIQSLKEEGFINNLD
ncbi:cell filamentation protein Fic [Wohlfahrtiimonas chitiniclastica]|uniref:Fic family protein n=1 Tax=Wohlfahrtiimonas chitiniclastica TaxID=400946 RepID=UPI000B9959B7|nr:Fic family protein [Wohlfahrtiimonas chitiniclastica]OYQ70542.1 cell filamentation protein Fic [Wohlfahrtiimonas chitiniclastica]